MDTGNGKKKREKQQCNLPSPCDRVASLRSSLDYSDLTITFPGHPVVMQAHRLILATNSPVFGAMLFGPLALPEGETLKLPDDPPNDFHWILEHVYLREVKFPNAGTALGVYRLASKYQMDNLVRLCAQHLRRTLTARAAPIVFQLSVNINDKLLQAACTKALPLNTDAVLGSEHFVKLNSEALEKLLSLPTLLPSSEVTLFQAILKWAYAQLEQEDPTDTDNQTGLTPKTQEKDQSKQELQLDETHLHAGESSNTHEELEENAKHTTKDSTINFESNKETSSESGSVSDLEFEDDPIFTPHSSPNLQDGIHKDEDRPDKAASTEQRQSVNMKLRRVIAVFLRYVKFLDMTTDEFVEEVMPHNIFTSKETRSILMNIRGSHIPNHPPLPKILNTPGYKSRMEVVKQKLKANPVFRGPMNLISKMEVSQKTYLKKVFAPAIVAHPEAHMCIKDRSGKVVGKSSWMNGEGVFSPVVRLRPLEQYELQLSRVCIPCRDHKYSVNNDGGLISKGIVYSCIPIQLELWCHLEARRQSVLLDLSQGE